MNGYETLKGKHQQEVNDFPFFFAFDKKQFAEGMVRFGLTPDDTDQIYSFTGGGYYLRSDAPRLHEMFARHEKERQEAIASDKTGKGYIYEMFCCELAGHEYGYTLNPEDTLDALGLTMEDIEKSPAMARGFRKAEERVRKGDVFN